MKNDVVKLQNYKSHEVAVTIRSLGMFLLQPAEDLSLTHTFIRKALQNPWVVFLKGHEELYVVPMGKGIFSLYVDVIQENRKIRDIKFFESVKAATAIGEGYEIIHFKK